MSRWTRFMYMHSGGSTKQPPYEYIYIEADSATARAVFYNRFGHNPDRVTCTCCGEDYSVDEHGSLEQATAFDRGCAYTYINEETGEEKPDAWVAGVGVEPGFTGTYAERGEENGYRAYCTLDQYLERKDVLLIRDSDIKPEEKLGEPPVQGFVWVN